MQNTSHRYCAVLADNRLTQEMSIWQGKDKILHDYYGNITQSSGRIGIFPGQRWKIKIMKMANVTSAS